MTRYIPVGEAITDPHTHETLWPEDRGYDYARGYWEGKRSHEEEEEEDPFFQSIVDEMISEATKKPPALDN